MEKFKLPLPLILDLTYGPLEVDVSVDPAASKVDVSVRLTNGCLFSSVDVAINWEQARIDKFVRDVSDFANWLTLNPNEMPVAVTRVNDTTMQIRVGYTAAPGPLVNIPITLDPSTCPDSATLPTASTALRIGQRISLIPSNLANMRVGHVLFGLHNIAYDGSDATQKNCTFTVERGLQGADRGFISLRSVNYPNFYANHFAFAINISAQENGLVYQQNASFLPIPGAAGGDTLSFIAHNFPTHRVRHSLNRLHIHPNESSALFQADSSFKVIPGLWTGPEGL